MLNVALLNSLYSSKTVWGIPKMALATKNAQETGSLTGSRGLWGTDAEWAEWRAAAELAGMAFNKWARRALNEQAELDRALKREEPDGGAVLGPTPT